MQRFFITGTGPSVGKTAVSCALIWQLRKQGHGVFGLKPIISGWHKEDKEQDTHQIACSLGYEMHNDVLDCISPWRFSAPLSPHMAARLEQREVPVAEMLKWCLKPRSENYGIIEGVGGVMVPLTDHYTTLDWMRDLELPVLCVTGSYLGAISHALTALAVLESTKLQVAGLIVNESLDSSVPFIGTVETLRGLSNVPVYAIPYIDSNEMLKKQCHYPWQLFPNISGIIDINQ